MLAGTACATEVFAQLDPAVQVALAASTTATRSGPGTKVGEVAGPLRSVLTGRAHRAQLPVPPVGGGDRSRAGSCDAAGDRPAIWDTRKTLPGLRAVEKAAVRAGGG